MNPSFYQRDRRNQEMDSSLTGSLLLLSVVFWQFVSAAEEINIKATTGAEVTMPCSDPDDNPIEVVEWSKSGLGAKFVLLFKDGMIDLSKQHPDFKDRVELLDYKMKGGDVSLVLKKVQINDTGEYECRVIQKADGEELRMKIYLDVKSPFPPFVIILLVLLSVCLTIATVLVYKNRRYFKQARAAQEQEEQKEEEEEEENDYGDDIKLNSED
ncbi:butyrophilin-like protein 3 isoform X1 [Poecilia formosa]|uniref:butyrophilin-like protein 3 isoform X1 n=1 Tax=Poecilia formosa TaxID=48698 RepID=UPI0007B8937B|nr:PREDICTED: butyrophilin-like protein 3 isoform X1 [Poecilia formosa]